MKILFCHNSYLFRGGEDQVFEDECWLLKSHGCQVVTYQRSNRDIAQIGAGRMAIKTIWNAQACREVTELIEREKPDVAHFHNTFPLISPAVYYAAGRQNVPVIQTLHNYRILCPKSILLRDGEVCRTCMGKWFAWNAVRYGCYKDSRSASFIAAAMLAAHWGMRTWKDAVTRYIVLTNFSKQTFVAGGLPEHKIRIKPNFVRPDPGFGTGKGDYAIFVGRLSPEKGIADLVKAWTTEGIRIPLWVVGEGPSQDLIEQGQQNGGNIRLLGFQDHARVLKLIADAKMLVFPSVWHETFGRSIIEAFATGTPVVATNMAPMNELIQHGQTGLLFQRSDPTDLARQVNLLSEDTQLWRSLRNAGRHEYEERFSPQTNYRQLMEIYDEALQVTPKNKKKVPDLQPVADKSPC